MASLSSPQSQSSFCSTSWESDVIQTATPSLSGFPACSGQRQNPGKLSRTHLISTGSPPCMSSSLCLSILLQAAAHLVLNRPSPQLRLRTSHSCPVPGPLTEGLLTFFPLHCSALAQMLSEILKQNRTLSTELKVL